MGNAKYRYMKTREQQWKYDVEAVICRLEQYTKLAVHNIYNFSHDHEVMRYGLYKTCNYKMTKNKWYVTLMRWIKTEDVFGPFDSKKEAEEYIEINHVIYLTSGTKFDELKKGNAMNNLEAESKEAIVDWIKENSGYVYSQFTFVKQTEDEILPTVDEFEKNLYNVAEWLLESEEVLSDENRDNYPDAEYHQKYIFGPLDGNLYAHTFSNESGDILYVVVGS